MLGVDLGRVSQEYLEIETAFQIRKRGVETKLVLNGATNPCDETLFINITKAHRYFGLICACKTYAKIAADEGVSKHRVQKLVDLAFLAPDVVAGYQPTGLTTEWLLRHAVPAL
jgi:site-specific DNA recombinase